MVEIGREKEIVQRRLNDIIWLAEHTRPVGDDWQGYAASICRILADQARQAIQHLGLVK